MPFQPYTSPPAYCAWCESDSEPVCLETWKTSAQVITHSMRVTHARVFCRACLYSTPRFSRAGRDPSQPTRLAERAWVEQSGCYKPIEAGGNSGFEGCSCGSYELKACTRRLDSWDPDSVRIWVECVNCEKRTAESEDFVKAISDWNMCKVGIYKRGEVKIKEDPNPNLLWDLLSD